jgi:hypothetical protein
MVLCSVLLFVGLGYGVAAGDVVPGLSMQAGDSGQVTCSGGSLSVANRSSTSFDVRCSTGRRHSRDGWRSQGQPGSSSGSTATTSAPGDSSTTSTTSAPSDSSTTTTTAPSSPSGPAPTQTTWWSPSPTSNGPWQWEIDHPLNLQSASDMGTGVDTYTGAPAPDPTIYDIDGIENPQATVTALHSLGDHAICYIEVGTAGDYYSAADEGISTTYFDQLQAAGVLGNKLSGYPEYFLNIDSPATVAIVESMIGQQCAAKGFDAVETDLDETYSGSDGTTGFSLTKGDEEQYMTTLANYMHSLGMGWIIKSPDDTGDSFAADMEPLADGVLSEQCNENSTCGLLSSYLGKKAIFNAEYNISPSSFCPSDNASGINGAKFDVSLSGGRIPCQ